MRSGRDHSAAVQALLAEALAVPDMTAADRQLAMLNAIATEGGFAPDLETLIEPPAPVPAPPPTTNCAGACWWPGFGPDGSCVVVVPVEPERWRRLAAANLVAGCMAHLLGVEWVRVCEAIAALPPSLLALFDTPEGTAVAYEYLREGFGIPAGTVPSFMRAAL